ncbi:hypothetical protein PanWU01x14_346160, partial [Parasponia andersonii]
VAGWWCQDTGNAVGHFSPSSYSQC